MYKCQCGGDGKLYHKRCTFIKLSSIKEQIIPTWKFKCQNLMLLIKEGMQREECQYETNEAEKYYSKKRPCSSYHSTHHLYWRSGGYSDRFGAVVSKDNLFK